MSPTPAPWISWLGAALVHFLWQAALVGLALAAAQPWLRRLAATTRYALYCAALLALPLLFAATLAGVAVTGADGLEWLPQLSGVGLHHAVAQAFPWLVALWAVGMAALAVRAAGGMWLAQRLRHSVEANVPAAWQQRLEHLRQVMGVSRAVRMGLSRRVPGPCVLGAWRPLILLPLSALTALPPDQIQALLAHELAHIRRHDYWVNLLQRGVEVVFFFHPAVWWLSRQVREEREHCCDDLAIAACGDRLGYARALVDLAEWGAQWVLAAAGGALGRRVRRILQGVGGRTEAVPAGLIGTGMAGLALAGLLLVGLPTALAPPPLPTAPAVAAQAVSLALPVDAKPARRHPPAVQRAAVPASPRRSLAAPAPRGIAVAWVLTQQWEEVPACAQQPVLVPEILPSGQLGWGVRTITRCKPVLRPVEVWVLTSI